jgi:hypothetical protein
VQGNQAKDPTVYRSSAKAFRATFFEYLAALLRSIMISALRNHKSVI